jgi:hypothetical protein
LEFLEAEFSRCAQSGIEAALLDLWGKIIEEPVLFFFGIAFSKLEFTVLEQQLYRMIGFDWSERPSFYTASLNEDMAVLLKAVEGGLQFTPFLKIKLDARIELGTKVLQALHSTFAEKHDFRKRVSKMRLFFWSIFSHVVFLSFFQWCIDANSCSNALFECPCAVSDLNFFSFLFSVDSASGSFVSRSVATISVQGIHPHCGATLSSRLSSASSHVG